MTDDKISTTAEAYEATAIPRRHEVHADPDAAPGVPLPNGVTDKPMTRKSPAEWAYERLILYIQTFEEQLDSDHEVAIGLTGSDVGVLRIEGMGFFDPDILTFYGTDPLGGKAQLIQHVSQLNVTLRAMPKLAKQEPPRRIGFRLVQDLENG